MSSAESTVFTNKKGYRIRKKEKKETGKILRIFTGQKLLEEGETVREVITGRTPA